MIQTCSKILLKIQQVHVYYKKHTHTYQTKYEKQGETITKGEKKVLSIIVVIIEVKLMGEKEKRHLEASSGNSHTMTAKKNDSGDNNQ